MAYNKGYDISSIQGNINFSQLKQLGYDFVVIKCYTGNDGRDPMYQHNVTAARAAGLCVAIYNFIYPLKTDPAHPNRDPIGQANLHYNACKGEQVVMVDCEWPQEGAAWETWEIDANFIRSWIWDYLQEFERLSGVKPIIYTYPVWAKAVGFTEEFSSYKLWIASYETNPLIPSPWTDWVMWQQTGGGGKLPNGSDVDTDVTKDLSLWWGTQDSKQSTFVEPAEAQITQPLSAKPYVAQAATVPANNSADNNPKTFMKGWINSFLDFFRSV